MPQPGALSAVDLLSQWSFLAAMHTGAQCNSCMHPIVQHRLTNAQPTALAVDMHMNCRPMLENAVKRVSCMQFCHEECVWAQNDGCGGHAQAQGIEAIAPDLLSTRPEYPLQVEMTPMPPTKAQQER